MKIGIVTFWNSEDNYGKFCCVLCCSNDKNSF